MYLFTESSTVQSLYEQYYCVEDNRGKSLILSDKEHNMFQYVMCPSASCSRFQGVGHLSMKDDNEACLPGFLLHEKDVDIRTCGRSSSSGNRQFVNLITVGFSCTQVFDRVTGH